MAGSLFGPCTVNGTGLKAMVRDQESRIVAVRHRLGGAENERVMVFIADAFNVMHETGLTPRELQEQRAELLGVLKDMMDVQDSTDDCWCEESRPVKCEACRARSIIDKVEGITEADRMAAAAQCHRELQRKVLDDMKQTGALKIIKSGPESTKGPQE